MFVGLLYQWPCNLKRLLSSKPFSNLVQYWSICECEKETRSSSTLLYVVASLFCDLKLHLKLNPKVIIISFFAQRRDCQCRDWVQHCGKNTTAVANANINGCVFVATTALKLHLLLLAITLPDTWNQWLGWDRSTNEPAVRLISGVTLTAGICNRFCSAVRFRW